MTDPDKLPLALICAKRLSTPEEDYRAAQLTTYALRDRAWRRIVAAASLVAFEAEVRCAESPSVEADVWKSAADYAVFSLNQAAVRQGANTYV